MRTTFINQLVEEARTNDKIVLIVGDLGYHVVEPFAEAYPDRFFNAGISEQNMAGMAAGLALSGYNVYIYSIGNFPTLRCLEQIRNDIAYYSANVKIVSVGAGFSYGSQGFTHHATEDIGIMRSLPNMVVCSPSDPQETKMITKISSYYSGPMYLRLGKAGETNIYNHISNDFTIGDINCYKESNGENVLFTTGSIMDYAVNWLKENDINCSIYSVPFIKPINVVQLKKIVDKCHNVIVLEEHQASCGLGSALAEKINDLYANGEIFSYPKIHRIAIEDLFFSISGDQKYLRNDANLYLAKELFK